MPDHREQRRAVQQWLQRAAAHGWVTPEHEAAFAQLESGHAEELFRGTVRPLVVGLFGGTGVGKSSLLNRLVGQPLARTGVQRPTSHELTAWLHEDVDLAELPEELPADRLTVGRHQDDGLRDVMLLDMPDIDSTAEENRALVFEWLARIDLLVYVVSPERYRDDVGWSVLRQRGQRHGWLFAMNHWDSGHLTQRDDLVQLLQSAGFGDPLVFCTSCRTPPGELPSPDEFDALVAYLRDLRAAHEIAELTRLGHAARLADLRGWLQHALAGLGRPDDPAPDELWQQHWQRFEDSLREGLDFPIRTAASRLAHREGSVIRDWLSALRGSGPPAEQGGPLNRLHELAEQVWDDWAATRTGETLDAFELSLRRTSLVPQPLRQALAPIIEDAPGQARRTVETTLRTSLARPGNALQRVARRGLGFLTVALPVAALGWVAWGVLRGYYEATTGSAAYLGSEFAVHSGLVVLFAWLIPFGLDRLLRPSLEQLVTRGLQAGVAAALEQLAERCRTALTAAQRQQAALRESGTELLGKLTLGRGTASAAVQRLLVTSPESHEP